MQAPNGQSCSLGHTKEMSIVLAGNVLGRCSQQFETAASSKTPLCFELTVFDAVMLTENYDGDTTNVSGQFRQFLNDVIKKLRMPYTITTVMGAFGSKKFYCHVEHIKEGAWGL
jgi:hypothetical protein